MIKIESVSKRFKDKLVLNDVSAVLENGRITSLIGLNGAGKSTLISLIMKYKKTDSGVIIKDSVSVMPDAESMIEDLTGEAFLNYISGLKKLTSEDRLTSLTLAEKLFLNRDLKKKIKGYSFGMKKKLSFIQAYLGDFDAYIFDEPTSGVDVESARVMMVMIKELKKRDKAILLTSHNIEELQEYSDYVYILKKGEIVNKGTVEEIRKSKGQSSYTIAINNVINLDITHFIHEHKYNLSEHTIEIYCEDVEKINKIITEILQQNIVIEGFWKNTESLKDAVFEKNELLNK